MKIVIITGIFPPDIGGPATYVPAIASDLVQRGHRVTVVTLSDAVTHQDNYPFHLIRLSRQQFKVWRALKTAWCIVRQGRTAEVMFVNGLALEAVVANALLRKPMVQKIVGDLAWERAAIAGQTRDDFEAFQRTKYGLRLELSKWLRSWWTRRANLIITPSQYLARCVMGWGIPEERIHVIYNAVECLDHIQPAQVPLGTALKLVTVGRLVPWKHVDSLVKVLSQLDEVGLVVIGDGPERQQLESLASSLGVADRVHFAGQRSKTETYALMAVCDIFVLNSSYEGLPHIVLEAMQFGLPVVATAAGGTPEVVSHQRTGLLIQVGNTAALLSAIQNLSQQPQLRETLGTAAKELVRDQFTWEAMVTQTECVLASLAEQGRS